MFLLHSSKEREILYGESDSVLSIPVHFCQSSPNLFQGPGSKNRGRVVRNPGVLERVLFFGSLGLVDPRLLRVD